eukprot:5826615-Heterocapsa_arctica.AAC.1
MMSIKMRMIMNTKTKEGGQMLKQNFNEEEEIRTGTATNKQARKRAEETQNELNNNKRRKNIEAHQE